MATSPLFYASGRYMMSEENETLADKVFELLRAESAGIPETLMAFQEVLSYQWAFLCPQCRANIAAKLGNDIPAMLDYANNEAARYESEGFTCH